MRKTARVIVSRWTTPPWPATLAGILVGAAMGALTLHASGVSEATALVRIHQPIDPDQIMTGTAPSADLQQSYISGEIMYFTSPGFAEAVAKQLNETIPPDLSAIQDVKSSIISLSATEANFEEAERIVNAALKVYSDHLQQQTRERGQAAIDALDSVIGQRKVQLQDQSVPPRTHNPPTPEDVLLLQHWLNDQQAPISQLVDQRLAIEVQTRRPAAVQVVQPPTETSVKDASHWSLGAVGGALIGGLVALAGALGWRKRVGVVTSPSALEGQIGHVLLPTVRLGAYTESSDAYAGLARSLYAQLPAPRSGRILLVGASADSGTEEVARLIAFAVAEHADVCVHLLDRVQTFDGFESVVDRTDGATAVTDGGSLDTSPALPEPLADLTDGVTVVTDDGSLDTSPALPEPLADLTDGVTVVIDGGSLDTSPALPEAAEDSSQIIIVAMIGRDVNDTVRMASQLARDSDVPISGVCTCRRIRRASFAWRRDNNRSKPAAPTQLRRLATAPT